MCGFDADQFGQAVKEGDVPGSHGAAGHQVIENTADVDHHLTRGILLVAITGQLGHQVVYHLCGCTERPVWLG